MLSRHPISGRKVKPTFGMPSWCLDPGFRFLAYLRAIRGHTLWNYSSQITVTDEFRLDHVDQVSPLLDCLFNGIGLRDEYFLFAFGLSMSVRLSETTLLRCVAQFRHDLLRRAKTSGSLLHDPKRLDLFKHGHEDIITDFIDSLGGQFYSHLVAEIAIEPALNKGLSIPAVHEPVLWSMMTASFIRWMSLKYGLVSERRRVYLLATRIDRSASFLSRMDIPRAESPHLISARLKGCLLGTFYHWALLIKRDDGHLRESILCQLTVSRGRVRLDATENPTLEEGVLENARFIGFTMCSNNLIRDQARQVLHSMPVAYNVMNNNCQTFCSRLLERIQHVTSSSELYTGRGNIHVEAFDHIVTRRAIELVCHTIAVERESSKAVTHSVDVAPSSLNAVILVVMNGLTLIVLYWSYKQLSGWLYSLLVLALALNSLYGNSGLFRLLHNRAPGEEACESDDMAKLAKLVMKHSARKSIGY
ncbi:hypothetical protein PFICI_11530 [Pestalotiopsis fici W106-1]|uniref:PPPDE domain-containing protein n=1 Tax=Pestalotiopsis fici (strain W106-1 / CGMCC3.15140) TaxID=1229662 RepID=W3WQM3_PESFW|nr:uncharacterized protein PFICI_11530 [Pestalotiopsis fici W106-1]ETS76143.1 hypothetical protein PFICI_11530 [Pestalotiopsis fici W106-1]